MHSAWILVRHLTVSHVILQHKLCNCGVSGCLPNWCRDYLSNRKQRVVLVVLLGYYHWSKLAPTGVLSPQGYQGSSVRPCFPWCLLLTCLMLFLLQVWWLCVHADDCKTSRVSQRPCDHESFQDDVNDLVPWSGLNHMSFNTKQCKLKRIPKNSSPILLAPLQLDGTTLQVTAEFSDLGLLITNHKLNCPGTLT